MSDDIRQDTSTGDVVDIAVDNVDSEHDRSVDEIRQEFGSTVGQIKDKFSMLLDLRDRRIQELEEKLTQEKPQKPKVRLVLVLDDGESTIEILTRYFDGKPVKLEAVARDEARVRVCSEDYDAVLIEAAIAIKPEVDGLALCRNLWEAGKGKKVIVMSSRPGDAIKNSVEQAGGVFLRKPFHRKQVVQLINHTCAGEA